jgi:hypothetical protein
MRTHGEFEWLFSSLAENPKYWGFIIPVKARSPAENGIEFISRANLRKMEWAKSGRDSASLRNSKK